MCITCLPQDVHNEYEAAGGHGDGIDFEHFVTYFNKLKARKHGKARRARKAGGDVKVEEGEAPPPAESVQQVFLVGCRARVLRTCVAWSRCSWWWWWWWWWHSGSAPLVATPELR